MERVGAGFWTVRSLVEEGKNPHTFALSPRTAAELSAARVYLAVGIEIDAAVKTRTPDGMSFVVVQDPNDKGNDPHLWLDPDGIMLIARAARDAFFEADPEHRAEYAEACSALESEVKEATRQAHSILYHYRGSHFYVQHDSFR